MTRDSSSDSLTKLHRLLVDHFDLDELRTLCFDLKVDYDTLRGEEKPTKARELITVMLRENRLAELAGKLRALHPKIAWPNVETLSPEERLAWTTATEMQSAADYLVALRDYCANLPYLTLHDIRPPKTLDEVYVPLKARLLPPKDEKPERDDEQVMLELERGGPLSIAEVMRQHDPPHVLILGEPGAGKSTLLRQLAEHAWEAPDKIGLDAPYLPILVPLRRLAAAEGALEERLNRALAAELTLTQALPQGFFTNWPKQTGANWLILLDALDEVPAEQRPQLMQWLRGLLGRIGQNRVVLTSRPSGYWRGELDDKLFGHYDLLSFTPDQTSEFAHKWFEDQAGQFLKELERVRAGALSGTPLLLTIAAKVYLEKGTLPERRSGLYEQFVDIWLSEAEQRGLMAELGDPVCDVAEFALARLALAMTEQPTQTEASLSKVAADYLRDAVPLPPDRAEVAGARFLKVMARRSGVFTRRGDTCAFIHPTFREYLAAAAVVRECGADLEQVWTRAISCWAEKDWREVALFALSVLSDQRKDNDGITALTERVAESSVEGLYSAGHALIERVKVKDWLQHAIIDRLIATVRTTEEWGNPFGPSALWILIGLGNYPRAVEGLSTLARDKKVDLRTREYVAQALGNLGRADDLLTLACDIKECESARVVAARTLHRLGLTTEATHAWLILSCDKKVDAWGRSEAAAALVSLGRADEAAQTWLTLARDKKVDASRRSEAAAALVSLGRADEAAQTWLALARDKKAGTWIRGNAVAALGEIGRADTLLTLARDKRIGSRMCESAIAALGELGRTDALLTLARDGKVDAWRREQAAELLGELGQAEEATVLLLVLGRDGKIDAWVREKAAEALIKFGRADKVLPIFLELTCNKAVEGWIRLKSAEALGGQGRSDEAASVMLELAHDEKVDVLVRWAAAGALGKLGQVEALLELASNTRLDALVRQQAATALSELGKTEETEPILLELARDERVIPWVRVQAAAVLSHFRRTDEAIPILLALARDWKKNDLDSILAATVLGSLGRADEAMSILLTIVRDNEMKSYVREEAVEGLGQFADAHCLAELEQIAQHDKDECVRRAAQHTIEQIRKRTEHTHDDTQTTPPSED